MAVDLDKVTGGGLGEGKITSDGYDFGYNLAVHYKACDWLSMGLTYRSQIDVTVDGEIEFSNPVGNTTMGATEPVPARASVGIMVKSVKKLSIEFDVTHIQWDAYKKLYIEYGNSLPATDVEKNWDNTFKCQVGVEYAYNDRVDLRAGYVYDNTPVPDDTVDYSIPGSDRQILSLGVGVDWNKWTFDISYGYLIVADRSVAARPSDNILESEFEDGDAHLLGFNATYSRNTKNLRFYK